MLIVGMDLPFLHIMFLPKLTEWTYRMPCLPSGIPYSIASEQETHFQRSKTVGPWWWNPLLLLCSPPSWSSCPDRRMKWSFENMIIAPIMWQPPAGLEQGSPEGGICLESASNIWFSFSLSQVPWIQESRSGKGSSSSDHSSLRMFMLPDPTTSSFLA